MNKKTTILICLLEAVAGLRFNRVLDRTDPKEFWAGDSEEGSDAGFLKSEIVPFDDNDRKLLETTGLRPQLEKRVQSPLMKKVWFIGDSLIRNQMDSLCYLVGGDVTYNRQTKYQHCATPNMDISYFSSLYPNENIISQLLANNDGPPTVIYFNAALWISHSDTHKYYEDSVYPTLIKATAESYAKAAPNSKVVFFLSHATCDRGHYYKLCPIETVSKLNTLAQTALANEKDGQGGAVGIADGFTLTKDKCDLSSDGRHYNTLLWHELNLLLDALHVAK